MVDGPLSPGEISRRLGISPAAATLAVQRMEEQGHVARAHDPADGRRTRILLCQGARTQLLADLAPMFAEVEQSVAGLSPDVRAITAEFLDEVSAALEHHSERQP